MQFQNRALKHLSHLLIIVYNAYKEDGVVTLRDTRGRNVIVQLRKEAYKILIL